MLVQEIPDAVFSIVDVYRLTDRTDMTAAEFKHAEHDIIDQGRDHMFAVYFQDRGFAVGQISFDDPVQFTVVAVSNIMKRLNILHFIVGVRDLERQRIDIIKLMRFCDVESILQDRRFPSVEVIYIEHVCHYKYLSV